MPRIPARTALLASALAALSCSTTPNPASPATGDNRRAAAPPVLPPFDAPAMADTAAREAPGLHNVVAFHEDAAGRRVYSGSAPDPALGFATLAAMGVEWIISVDGAEPELAAARAHGLRYIHLPIGYHGFDEARALELTKATRDALLEGSVYIHCHHGKHRSAGAAAAVAVSMGWMSHEDAVARMKVSGTAPQYPGLYACARDARVVPAAALDALPDNFPEVSRPPGLVAAMVEIDLAHEHLRLIQKAGWTTPADHPDLVPAAEAGRLADLFRLMSAHDDAASRDENFRVWMAGAAAAAQEIETLLAGNADPAAGSSAELTARFEALSASCRDCHASYRDKRTW